MTQAENLKAKVIELLEKFLNVKEEEILTGIEDGIYEEAENAKTLQEITDNKKLVEEFKNYTPTIYAYIEGGNLQSISATETIMTEVYDKDNYDQANEEERAEMGTPDYYYANIVELTQREEIMMIY